MDNYEGKLVKGYWGGGSPSVGVLYIEESFSRGKMYVVNGLCCDRVVPLTVEEALSYVYKETADIPQATWVWKTNSNEHI